MSRRLFGFHPVREALRHRPHEVAEVLLAAGRGGHRAGEIESLCARHGVPVRRVAAAVLREQGWIASGGPA
ncbi:MAG TPA: RNA methyltransferase substrate-binding domain-containing protein, partial [Thermoanaerobaculia bacterium]|nr:RNA methyltransferase substrate-binding domain-containing protein [Thermoanaerobaculia bacterium]